MIRFHIPSFTIAFNDIVIGVADVTGYYIQYTVATILVYEDLLYQCQRKTDPFEGDLSDGVWFQIQCIQLHLDILLCIGCTKRNLAITFQRYHNVLLNRLFDTAHMLGSGIPSIG